jgi:hypothetical protein
MIRSRKGWESGDGEIDDKPVAFFDLVQDRREVVLPSYLGPFLQMRQMWQPLKFSVLRSKYSVLAPIESAPSKAFSTSCEVVEVGHPFFLDRMIGWKCANCGEIPEDRSGFSFRVEEDFEELKTAINPLLRRGRSISMGMQRRGPSSLFRNALFR